MERNVRTQAYLDGIEAGMSVLQAGGLSQPPSCEGVTAVQDADSQLVLTSMVCRQMSCE